MIHRPAAHRLAVFAAVAAGAFILGAQSASSADKDAEEQALRATFLAMPQTPHFVRITSVRDGGLPQTEESCTGPEQMIAVLDQNRASRLRGDPDPLKRCTSTFDRRPDGSLHNEMTCAPSDKEVQTRYMVSDGVVGDMRSHTQTVFLDRITHKEWKSVTDSHVVTLGACPLGMRSGQVRKSDGTIVDGAAELAALMGKSKVAKTPSSGEVPATPPLWRAAGGRARSRR